jgi:hypothetical protein
MSAEAFDWGLREAVEIVDFLTKREDKRDWGFGETIDKAAGVVEAEQEAKRKKEAAERARLEKARENAMAVRDKVIIPLLNDLRDDFAADEEKVLPQWHVRSFENGEVFSAAAATPDIDPAGKARFTITAQAAVAEGGVSVNLAVVCSTVNTDDPSAGQLAPPISKLTKFPAGRFDEWGSRKWLYDQLVESARMCVLTRLRHLPTSEDQPAVR